MRGPSGYARNPQPANARRQGERQDVEDDIAACDPARGISLREAEAGHDSFPRPRADGGPVELERRDDEEDACVDRALRLDQDGDEKRAADGAGRVTRGKNRKAGNPPRTRHHRSNTEEQSVTSSSDHCQRDAAEKDESVTRRDESRQVVESVRVEAPDERADDLSERRDADDQERLDANRPRLENEQASEHRCRQEPEKKLTSVADVAVGPQARGHVRNRDDEGENGCAAHRRRFVLCALPVQAPAASESTAAWGIRPAVMNGSQPMAMQDEEFSEPQQERGYGIL